MSKIARRLGRGLESLVPNLRNEFKADNLGERIEYLETDKKDSEADVRDGRPGNASMARISELKPNKLQPRKIVPAEGIESLAASIRANGLLQPIVVRRDGIGFEIIAGERRWRAAKAAGLTIVPIVVREATDAQMLELALLENIQREDLNAIDRAKAYREYCDRFDARPEELADRLGENRSTVSNYLRLLELDEEIQMLVAIGRLTMGHARSLLGVASDSRRLELAHIAAETGLAVRGLEDLVRGERATKKNGARKDRPAREKMDSAQVRDMTKRFEENLKTRVDIVEGKRKGTGRIIIHYYTLDDFDRVAELVGVRVE
jgi:ParB family chromosome partitioning protein